MNNNGIQKEPVLHVSIVPCFNVTIQYMNGQCVWVAKSDTLQIGVMADTPHELQKKIGQVIKEREKPAEKSRIFTV